MINNQSSPEEKVRLFSSLFQGRPDLYARRYVSTTTGKTGYSPVCLNRWQAGVCDMRHVRCAVCPHRRFASLTDDVFLHHLLGTDEGRRPFSAAVYPLRPEERTRFAVVSIGETNLREDAAAVRQAALDLHVPCAVELARRGEGAHVREKEPVTRKLWDGTSVCPLGGNGVPVTERNDPRHLCYLAMREKTLSVFVDESGRFQHPDDDSPYYIISLVLHDQSQTIDGLAADLDRAFRALRLTNVCFHAGPLIRQKGPFAFMDWSFRYKIFNCMMAFARKANFKYHCLVLDKRYVNSREQMVARLSSAMSDFLDSVADRFEAFDKIKIYYDCGQTPVTNLLHATFKVKAGQGIEFAQAVLPEKYKLFQLADMICTLRLVELKLNNGDGMTQSEYKFFGGPRKFRRNFLKFIKAKEI